MTKPSIRHHPDGWEVRRPGYGFTPASSTVYPTWTQARDSVLVGLGTAGEQITQASDPAALRLRGCLFHRAPIRVGVDDHNRWIAGDAAVIRRCEEKP